MTRTLIVVAAFLTLSLPAALAAPPEGKGKPENPGKSALAPGQSAAKSAAKKCKAERASMSADAYRAKYKSSGLGKCIAAEKQKAKKDKAKADEEDEAEKTEAEENAAKKCKAERETLGLEEFKKKYAPPTHPNGANAFGKCVSKLSKATTS
jgi:hypothetical protein